MECLLKTGSHKLIVTNHFRDVTKMVGQARDRLFPTNDHVFDVNDMVDF